MNKSLFAPASGFPTPNRAIVLHPVRHSFSRFLCAALLAIGGIGAAHAQDRELHVVGIYGASPESVANHSEGIVSVIVNRPGKVLTLLLSAYEPTLWQLNVGAGTTIEKVIVTGYYRQRAQGVPPGAEVVSQSYETGTGYLLVGDRIDSRQFLASVPKVRRLTGMEMSSFNGNHVSNDPMSFTIDSVQDDPRIRTDYPQPVPISELPNLEFQMAFQDGESVVMRDYTLAGPRSASTLMPPGMRVVADASKRFYYGAESHTVLKFDTANGTVEEIPYPIVAPEGWPMGTAFDSKRGRVVVVSLGSEGFLYSNTPPSTQWTLLASADNRDYDAIEYHATNDSYYALGTTYERAPVIHHLSAHGVYLEGEIRLPLQPFAGHDDRSEIVSVGKYLVVLFGPGRYVRPDEFPDSRMYLVDPETGQFWLTYRKVGQPVNLPPTVQMTAPENEASFDAGTPVLLRAQAADSDGAIDSVEFFANNQSVGNGVVAADGSFERTWIPSAGRFSLSARATDKEGKFSFSSPVFVVIHGNLPPTVRIRAMNSQLNFSPGKEVQLIADASDDGTVKTVEFFIDGRSIGEADNVVGTTYLRTWTTPGVGTYMLTAKATDDQGVSTTSPAVSVVVRENRPPMVRIVSPVNGATLRTGSTIQLAAEAFDYDENVPRPPFTANPGPVVYVASLVRVEFFLNDASIGVAKSVAGILYRLGWVVPAPGTYTLRAKATDGEGATTSASVRVVVRENRPPMVRIVSPTNGAVLRSGATVQLAAEAFDFDGDPPRAIDTTSPVPIIVAPLRVEFFANDASIGIARSIGGILYRLGWLVPAPGTYTLRAKATDRDGATTVSGPVEVTVVDAPVVALRHLPRAYRPGGKLRVRITLDPAATVLAQTIEDKPPAGWVVTRVSRGGTYDPLTGTVRFGSFDNNRRRIVGYQVEVPANATGVQRFVGSVVADGVTVPIGGDQTIGPVGQPRKTGIKGVVLRPTLLRAIPGSPLPIQVLPIEVPAANVQIWISDDSLQPAFSVRTDNEGRFQVDTGPGTFHVVVPELPEAETVWSNLLPISKLPATQAKTLDVKVEENQVTEVTIHLAARTTVGEPRLIYAVDEVTLSPSETLAPIPAIKVSAKGLARTSGWTNPQLRVRKTLPDGIVELEFVAVPPEGVSLPVLPPLSATAEVETPANFRGVRVFAETNSKEALQQPPPKTGIKGLVLRPIVLRGPTLAPAALAPIAAEVPAANVQIWISDDSTRPAFGVRTDSEGRFQVDTWAATFHVTVPALPEGDSNLLPNFKLPATQAKTLDVKVEENQVREVVIHLVAATVGETRLIYSVEEITLGAVDFPPVAAVLVVARGTATTSGWTNPQLRRRNTTSDGIVELDFVALPPDGVSLQVLTPISASATVETPTNFRGVRVFAATNSKEVLFPIP